MSVNTTETELLCASSSLANVFTVRRGQTLWILGERGKVKMDKHRNNHMKMVIKPSSVFRSKLACVTYFERINPIYFQGQWPEVVMGKHGNNFMIEIKLLSVQCILINFCKNCCPWWEDESNGSLWSRSWANMEMHGDATLCVVIVNIFLQNCGVFN